MKDERRELVSLDSPSSGAYKSLDVSGPICEVVPGKEVSPRWSVVIPAYNEEKRLPAYLREVIAYFDGKGESYEVVVVNDGSQDDTEAVVESLQESYSALRLVRLPCNRGKGYAVRAGMLNATGELRLFADADGATPIQEVEKLKKRIVEGADIAIGSRALRDKTRTVRAKWRRMFFGRIFNLIVQCLNVKGITDTQCGFKLFPARAAIDLFSVLQVGGYGFDVELLFVAQRRGYRIAEVAVNWADQAGSKVRIIPDGLRMLREVRIICRNQFLGLYASRDITSSQIADLGGS
jgi:dolichyl-phosphate beta-glucosyltransferase